MYIDSQLVWYVNYSTNIYRKMLCSIYSQIVVILDHSLCGRHMQMQCQKLARVPFLEVFSTLPRCAKGMKGGGPSATSERAVSRLCAANDYNTTIIISAFLQHFSTTSARSHQKWPNILTHTVLLLGHSGWAGKKKGSDTLRYMLLSFSSPLTHDLSSPFTVD